MLNTYAAIMTAIVLGYGSYNWISWSALTASDWASWTGAIGTILAFCGTIWVATYEARFRTRQRKELAMIAAEGLKPQIEKAIQTLGKVLTLIEGSKSPSFEKLSGFNMCSRSLDKLVLWSNSDLVALAPLPNNCAINLAQSVRQIRDSTTAFQHHVKSMGRSMSINDSKFLKSQGLLMAGSLSKLNSAFIECDLASVLASDFH